MGAIWLVLLQFVFRLTFGMALAMAATNSRLVTSGYFRVHLWVLLGLNTFAALAAAAHRQTWSSAWFVFALACAAAVLSYVGSVLWLYEQRRFGKALLLAVSMVGLAGAIVVGNRPSATPSRSTLSESRDVIATTDRSNGRSTVDSSALSAGSTGGPAAFASQALQIATSGWLMGATMMAMLLGHWYLNTPGMQLAPLKKLILLMVGGVGARALVCAAGLAWAAMAEGAPSPTWWSLVALRWASGLAGVLLLAWLAWKTLLVPNTQSATGILYAAVIIVFMGELSSQFLSLGTPYPL